MKVLQACKRLSDLNLSDCDLSETALVEMTTHLKESKVLTNHNFSLNQIGGTAEEIMFPEKKQENKLATDNFIENMVTLISTNEKLFHLNLEGM